PLAALAVEAAARGLVDVGVETQILVHESQAQELHVVVEVLRGAEAGELWRAVEIVEEGAELGGERLALRTLAQRTRGSKLRLERLQPALERGDELGVGLADSRELGRRLCHQRPGFVHLR